MAPLIMHGLIVAPHDDTIYIDPWHHYALAMDGAVGRRPSKYSPFLK
jgi:hypothetical protein